jgi:hypothetical protein
LSEPFVVEGDDTLAPLERRRDRTVYDCPAPPDLTMEDFFGSGCPCGTDPADHPGYCSDCGERKVWVSRGVGAEVFECPDCE